ncbi:hypothetical protein BH23GEM10_BH23GEM10_10650 [soil metagenome]
MLANDPHMMSEHPGPAYVPQIVIVERIFSRRQSGIRFMESERVIRRVHGLQGIVSYAGRANQD